MRKLIVILLVALCAPSIGYAQQLPQYTYFTYNYLNYNPAVTGATQCMELKLGHRRQWMGIKGAPITSFASVHGRFKQVKNNFHGLGAVVETDEAGPFSFTSLHANYAYHMRIARKYTLSSGLAVGFTQYRLNFGNITLENSDDQALFNSVSAFIRPTFNLGFWLYNSDRFFGFSIRQVTSPKVKGLPGTKLMRHYTFAVGRAIKVSDDILFKPAALLNYVGKSKPSVEAQALVAYKEKVTVGVAGRAGNGLSVLMKLDVIKHVTIAYAYDLTASRLRNQGASSHELTIGLRACAEKEKFHVPCAAYD
jgi:type IX secretion system PorP/SprF family membrane protein